MHQKRHQPLHQVQPLQQPQQPLPRHTSVNRHGVVVALEDDDLDLLQVRMICNVQWVKLNLKIRFWPFLIAIFGYLSSIMKKSMHFLRTILASISGNLLGL